MVTSSLTTSATRKSRTVRAAVSTAVRAAASQESVLVPITSVTRYTLSLMLLLPMVVQALAERGSDKLFLSRFRQCRLEVDGLPAPARRYTRSQRSSSVCEPTFAAALVVVAQPAGDSTPSRRGANRPAAVPDCQSVRRNPRDYDRSHRERRGGRTPRRFPPGRPTRRVPPYR